MTNWTSLAGNALKEARNRAGLTQRELARLAGIPQSEIARIETGVVQPSLPTLGRILDVAKVTISLVQIPIDNRVSASEAAPLIAKAIRDGSEERALRQWLVLFDDLLAVSQARFCELVVNPPALTGYPQWDALIAGTVEYLAQKKKTIPPKWTEDSRRRCEGWYFSGISELEVIEKAESPKPFARRGVYITEADLSRV